MNKRLAKLEEQFGLLRSRAIYYWKPFNRRRLMNFYSQFIQPGALCFDIGAHLGNRLDAWLQLQSKVIALDPQPSCFQFLQKHFGNHPNATILPHAVGKALGKTEMHVSRLYPTVSTLAGKKWREALNNASEVKVTWDEKVEVEVTTLDQLIEQYGMPDFCKIDVEGFEAKVLKGLSQPIPILSFEFLSDLPEERSKCIQRLNNLGNYKYNWSPGESQQMELNEWVDANTLLETIEAAGDKAFSGDIYARI